MLKISCWTSVCNVSEASTKRRSSLLCWQRITLVAYTENVQIQQKYLGTNPAANDSSPERHHFECTRMNHIHFVSVIDNREITYGASVKLVHLSLNREVQAKYASLSTPVLAKRMSQRREDVVRELRKGHCASWCCS